MKKKLLLGFVLFSLLFVAVSFVRYYPIVATNLGVNLTPLDEPKGVDADFYLKGMGSLRGVGYGHSLTLVVSQALLLVSPSSITGVAFLGFFSLFFVWSAYYFVRSHFKRPWLIFVLAPFSLYIHRIATAGTYAQLFSISLFLIALGLYSRNKKMWSSLMMIPVFLAHFWTGGILIVVFIAYILMFDRETFVKKWKIVLPFVALSLLVALRVELYHRLIEFALWYHQQGGSLFASMALNPSNNENVGILLLGCFGVLGLKRKNFEKMLGVWFLVLISLIVIFWGGVISRVWMMMPFLFLSLIGVEHSLENRSYLIPIIVAIMLLSGWFIA